MARLHSIIGRLLFHAGRMADRVSRMTVYLAAGSRPLSEMRADSRKAWDAFYQSHPTHDARLLPWEEEFVDRFVPQGAAVLVVGCGSGRDLLPLVDRGCRVTGIDPSVKGLAIAEQVLRSHDCSATLIEGFFEDVAISQAFDVVIFSYYSYAALAMGSRRVAALTKAAALLNASGHVIVSHAAVIAPPHPILVRLGRLAGTLARSDWRIEPGDVISDNRERTPSMSLIHAFAEGELEREAAAAHLRLVCRRVSNDHSIVAVMGPM